MTSASLRWRLVVDPEARSGPRNMALDHALAEELGPGQGVLRLYRWEPHTISFGRNEPAAGRYDVEAAAREGLAFVRRPTGGRAVLHAHEMTYCAVLPVRALGGLRAAYVRINEGLVRGLRALGVPADVARDGAILPPDAGPCFQSPTPGEVVVAGRKLVGSAQVRVGRTILQHGSVILRGDQSALSRLSDGAQAASAPPATVDAFLGGPADPEAVARALAEGLRLALEGEWTEGAYLPEEIERADGLERDRYGRDSWTWRR